MRVVGYYEKRRQGITDSEHLVGGPVEFFLDDVFPEIFSLYGLSLDVLDGGSMRSPADCSFCNCGTSLCFMMYIRNMYISRQLRVSLSQR